MNSDIKIMIELQRYWQNILAAKKEIERNEKNLALWEEKLQKLKKDEEKAGGEVKALKQEVKKNELELESIDARIKKLEDRRLQLKTEKETGALEKELAEAKEEDDTLESALIEMMDNLATKEDELTKAGTDYKESGEQLEKDREVIQDKIRTQEETISKNQSLYDQLLPNLGAGVKTRFLKLLSSKNGQAIGPVEGEICGSCNFQVPAQLAMEAKTNEAIVTCTNCGRFLYSKEY